MKKLILLTLILSGCATQHQATQYDWRDYVLPMQGGQYVSEVDSISQETASKYALRFARQACDSENKRLEVVKNDSIYIGPSDSEKAGEFVGNVIGHTIANRNGMRWNEADKKPNWRSKITFECK